MFLLMFATPAFALISSVPIFSILFIPIMHLNILICVLSSKSCSAYLGVQVSLPHITFIRTEPLIILINVHHVDTIFHKNSSYVTTILYGTSTCGCKLIRPFRKSYFHVSYSRRMPGTLAWQWAGLGDACQSGEMAIPSNSLFFGYKLSA